MARRKPKISRQQRLLQKWRPLYELADRIKEIAPWEWMLEDEIFGVADPETGQVNFVSVMGTLGEHLSVAVYLGTNALHQFKNLSEIADTEDTWVMADRLFRIPQLQLAFESREMVEKEDSRIMRKLNLKYHGRNAYPVFRAIKPGCPYWFMDEAHIPVMQCVLEQLLDVAPRFEADPDLLYPDDVDDQEAILIRVPRREGDEIVWVDEIRPVPPPEPIDLPISVPADVWQSVQDAPPAGNIVEIDLFMMPGAIQDKWRGQPYYPFSLILVEADTGFILAHEMLTPQPAIEDMYAAVPPKVAEMLARLNMRPYEIHVQDIVLLTLLRFLPDKLDVPLKMRPFLPYANEARTALIEHMSKDW